MQGVAAVYASSVSSRRAGRRLQVKGASAENTANISFPPTADVNIPPTHRRVELGQDPLAGKGQGGHVQLLRGLELQRAEGRESQAAGAQLGGRRQQVAATTESSRHEIRCGGEHACLTHCSLPPLSAPRSPAATAHRPPQASAPSPLPRTASPRLSMAKRMAFHSLLHQWRYDTTRLMSRLMSRPCNIVIKVVLQLVRCPSTTAGSMSQMGRGKMLWKKSRLMSRPCHGKCSGLIGFA